MASLPKSGPVPFSNGPGRLFIAVGSADVATRIGSRLKTWKTWSSGEFRTQNGEIRIEMEAPDHERWFPGPSLKRSKAGEGIPGRFLRGMAVFWIRSRDGAGLWWKKFGPWLPGANFDVLYFRSGNIGRE